MKIKKFAVIGNNVESSLSPFIFNKWFEINKESAVYEYIKIIDLNNDIIKSLVKEYDGFNITIPHKESILKFSKILDSDVQIIKAANVAKIENKKILLFNSDKLGFINSIKLHSDIKIANYNEIYILGYGGAAKAVEIAISEMKYKQNVKIFNRKIIDNKKFFNINNIQDFVKNDILIINCTSCGNNNNNNLDITFLNNSNIAVIDVVYKPYFTQLLNVAAENNFKFLSGIYMLLEQAIITYKYWFGYVPKYNQEFVEELKLLCK